MMKSSESNQRLELLHRAVLAFNSSLALDDVLHSVLEEVRKAIKAEAWSVWLLNETSSELVCRQAVGPGRVCLEGMHVPTESSLMGQAIREQKCLYVADAAADPRLNQQILECTQPAPGSLLAAPLRVRPATKEAEEKALGVINIIGREPNAFDHDDLALLEALALAAAAAINNAQLHEQTERELRDRSRAERALQSSETRYRTLIETSPEAIIVTDLNGKITMCNRRALDLYRISRAELLDRHLLSLVAQEHRAEIMTRYDRVLQGQAVHNLEIPLVRNDGSLFQGEFAASLISDDRGQPSGIVAFTSDITARKAAEATIRRHNQELRILNRIATQISQAHDLSQLLTTALDLALEAVGVDTGWIDIFGASRSGVREPSLIAVWGGSTDGVTPEVPLEPLQTWARERLKTSQSPVIANVAEVATDRVAEELRCPLVGVPLRIQGEVSGALCAIGVYQGYARDIDLNQVQLLTAIAQQISSAVENARLSAEAAEMKVLREIDQMRSELLAGFSHDLRSPLGLIKMTCSTLLREELDLDAEEAQEMLKDIETQTDRLSRLVTTILDLGRLENGQLALNRLPFDMCHLIRRVARDLGKLHPSYRIRLELPSSPLDVVADWERVEQVLCNLIDNAAKYTPEPGEITISARTERHRVVISVRDPGIGIPSDERALIFERFYRVENEMTRHVGGVGLGLAMCKGIVEAHGGRIWADANPEGGSVFSFTLPSTPSRSQNEMWEIAVPQERG